MRIHLLENPSAGRGRGAAYLEHLVRTLEARGATVERIVGVRHGDLARHVEALAPEACDALLLAGGDGTLRAVLNARAVPLPWPVGVLALGTANLVAREAGTLPLPPPERLAGELLEAEPWSVDLLEFRSQGGRPERAITTVSAGVDGAIVQAVARLRANGRGGGYAKWVGPILESVGRAAFAPMEVSVDGASPIRCIGAVVQNTLCYGGLFRLSPDARLDTGRAEVVTFHAETPRDLLRLGVRATLRSVHRDRQLGIVHGRSVKIRSAEPRPLQADGDPAGFTDVDVRVHPGALRLLRVVRAPARAP